MKEQHQEHNLQSYNKWVKKQHFHFPVSNVSFLLHRIEFKLNQLWELLERSQCVQEVILHIKHELNDKQEIIRLKSLRAHNDVQLFIQQIENKILSLNLSNPVIEFDLEVIPKEKTKSRFFILKQKRKPNMEEEEFLLALQNAESPELPAVYTTVRIKSIV